MKIFVLTRQNDSTWEMSMGADSSLLRPGEPVFLPESGNEAQLAIVPAIRIGRLGYCIRSNFASYVDAVTLFQYLRAHPDDVPAWLPPYVADRTFSPGIWQPLPSNGLLQGTIQIEPLPGRQGDSKHLYIDTTIRHLEPERHIREISQYCTIKTGDILIFPAEGTPLLPAIIDTHVTAALNGTSVLDIRLK